MTKLVRFVQRGPRYVGLSPLKMVQLKPHCSDAAALERDTASFASKTGSKFLVCRAFIGDHKSPTGVVFPVIEISLPIDAFGVRLPMSPSIYEIFQHRLRGVVTEGRPGKISPHWTRLRFCHGRLT